jgi:hypothetical protein
MILNISKGTKLANKASYCDNLWKKTFGLMFRSFRPLIFVFNKEQVIPLHMLFVFYPIDALWLDKNKRVVEFKTLKPFTFYRPKNRALFVLELAKNTINNTRTQAGDTITFK